jgi:hypothetical protein
MTAKPMRPISPLGGDNISVVVIQGLEEDTNVAIVELEGMSREGVGASQS